jgi:hypothetical protein
MGAGSPLGTLKMTGYATTLESIKGRTNFELEQTLGFGEGTLGPGFDVYRLVEPVYMGDFVWRDKTRYSAGWHADPSVKFGPDSSVVWCVQRQDELRWALAKQHNFDDHAIDAEVRKIMQKSLDELKQRSGPKMIVKVKPRVSRGFYPNARAGNIPQWELVKEKQFSIMLHGTIMQPR